MHFTFIHWEGNIKYSKIHITIMSIMFNVSWVSFLSISDIIKPVPPLSTLGDNDRRAQ